MQDRFGALFSIEFYQVIYEVHDPYTYLRVIPGVIHMVQISGVRQEDMDGRGHQCTAM